MKLTWKNKTNNKSKKRPLLPQYPNLPFDQNQDQNTKTHKQQKQQKADDDKQLKPEYGLNPQNAQASEGDRDDNQLAEAFLREGNKFAEDGEYREALGKWEAALTLAPERAVLHEQKAQVLLEIGEAWNALKAATRATELDPSWAEAWITVGRAQLNFGEPDSAITSFDRALAIKPDSVEARDDSQTALHLVKRRKQLHSSGLSIAENRYAVGDKSESS